MMLCDLGAEIIKVERPLGGDFTRGNGPFIDGVSVYFESISRGKKSITLNLTTPKGKELLLRLVDTADVLVSNYVPGAMERLGLDYETLKARNPALIYATVSGFGQTGPYAQYPAFDVIVQAMGGIMSITGEPGGAPVRPGASIGDIQAGIFTAISILAALYERNQSGQGQAIDISMLDCQVATLENAFARYLIAGEVPTALGTRHPVSTPFQAFETKDGYVVVAIVGGVNDQWPLFCSAIGRLDLIDDPRYKTSYLRSVHYDELEPIMSAPMKQKTTREWLEDFRGLRIPCGPLNTIPQVASDPQILAREMIVEIENPKLGKIKMVGTPFHFSRTRPKVSRPAPSLGEHNQEVLGGFLGLTPEEMKSLKAEEVVA